MYLPTPFLLLHRASSMFKPAMYIHICVCVCVVHTYMSMCVCRAYIYVMCVCRAYIYEYVCVSCIHIWVCVCVVHTYMSMCVCRACIYEYVCVVHAYMSMCVSCIYSQASSLLCRTGWQRPIGSLIFIGHSPQKSSIMCGSFAERDLQLKASYASSPLYTTQATALRSKDTFSAKEPHY